MKASQLGLPELRCFHPESRKVFDGLGSGTAAEARRLPAALAAYCNRPAAEF
jgi:hypothetical protein